MQSNTNFERIKRGRKEPIRTDRKRDKNSPKERIRRERARKERERDVE